LASAAFALELTGTAGSQAVTASPAGAGATANPASSSSVMAWRAAMLRTMDRPRPLPGICASDKRNKRSNTRSRMAAGIPGTRPPGRREHAQRSAALLGRCQTHDATLAAQTAQTAQTAQIGALAAAARTERDAHALQVAD